MADDQIQYLRDQYEDLNRQWDQTQVAREAEHRRRLAEMDKNAEGDVRPIFGAGIAALRNQNPVEAYQVYRQIPINRQIARGTMIDDYNSDKAKQLSDLREKVMSRMNAATAAAAKAAGEGTPFETKVFGNHLSVTDRRNGVTTMVASDQVPLYKDLLKTHFAALMSEGGKTHGEMQIEAQQRALHDINFGNTNLQRMPNRPTEGLHSTPPTSPMVGQPLPIEPISTAPQSARVVVDPKNPLTPEQLIAIEKDAKEKGLVTQPPVIAPKGFKTPSNAEILAPSPTGVSTTPLAPAPAIKGTYIPTPQERKFKETNATNWANEVPKLTESIKANQAKLGSYDKMEGMLLSGNTPSGPLNPYLTEIGAFASTYDPNGTLAEKYGNNAPAYFGELMNLVRSDIKALGAGTAVSNLDLIVSQMAAGDLRNSPQGNLRLIGLQKYVAAEKAEHDKKYLDYINANGNGTGFLTGAKIPSSYALRPKLNSKGLKSYVLETRAQYEQRHKNKFGNLPNYKPPSEKQWLDYSKKSVSDMFNSDYDPKKVK